MTNEQTAVMLISYVRRLMTIAENVESLITEGERELKQVWIGSDKLKPHPIGANLISEEVKRRSKDWEEQPIDEFKAVSIIKEFSEEIKQSIRYLMGEDEHD